MPFCVLHKISVLSFLVLLLSESPGFAIYANNSNHWKIKVFWIKIGILQKFLSQSASLQAKFEYPKKIIFYQSVKIDFSAAVGSAALCTDQFNASPPPPVCCQTAYSDRIIFSSFNLTLLHVNIFHIKGNFLEYQDILS